MRLGEVCKLQLSEKVLNNIVEPNKFIGGNLYFLVLEDALGYVKVFLLNTKS